MTPILELVIASVCGLIIGAIVAWKFAFWTAKKLSSDTRIQILVGIVQAHEESIEEAQTLGYHDLAASIRDRKKFYEDQRNSLML